MFPIPSGSFIALLVIISYIGLSICDINTGFNIKTAVPNNGRLDGGCAASEITALASAFTETIEMVTLIQTAAISMQGGTELPAVGWMFNALFGIQASEELSDRGIGRPQEQTDALGQISNLMQAIARHSQGLFTPIEMASAGKARIFCNEGWVITTNRLIDPVTRTFSVPTYFLPDNALGSQGIDHWYDYGINVYLHVADNLPDPSKRVCGNNNAAYTSTDSNVISFCELQFTRPATVGQLQPPLTAPFPGIPPDSLDAFNTVSMTFLHEYTHFVGRQVSGQAPAPSLPVVELFPEHYQFPAANQLLKTSGTNQALQNADSYALLGVALKLSNCDWRDGACRSPGYWDALRQQRLRDARTLLGLRSVANRHKI